MIARSTGKYHEKTKRPLIAWSTEKWSNDRLKHRTISRENEASTKQSSIRYLNKTSSGYPKYENTEREYNNGISQINADFTKQRSTSSNRFNNQMYQKNFQRRHTNLHRPYSWLNHLYLVTQITRSWMKNLMYQTKPCISYTPLTADSLNQQALFYTIPAC